MSKEITLNNRWKLLKNQYDYQIMEFVPEHVLEKDTPAHKKGAVIPAKWKPLQSYHPSVEKAIQKIISIEVEEAPSCDWSEYLSQLKEVNAEFNV